MDPTNVDEYGDYARLTGIRGVYRVSHSHVLNQKAVARFHARKLGKRYELRKAHNYGIVGSRLEGNPKLVLAYQTGASTAAVIGAVWASATIGAAKPLVRLGAGLAAGGALSNMIERWTAGHVTDYIHGTSAPIGLLQKRIWNVADMAIFNGCVIALAGYVL